MEVVHVRDGFDTYIGRRCGVYPESRFANPFKLASESDRFKVIEQYSIYIRDRLRKEPDLLAELIMMQNDRVGCWCAPKACHGNVLKLIVHEILRSI